MNLRQRKLWSLVLMLMPGGPQKRAEFIRKHHLYGSVGKNCMIMKKKLPLYSNLVYLHDNVWIASNVGFVTHDVIHSMLNHHPDLSGGGQICREGRLYRSDEQRFHRVRHSHSL